jgi:NADPH:quinone reductase-like Zn-dependent oxidoreductase
VIQLLKISGFSTIITTASKRNEQYCMNAGATHVIDYHDVPYSELYVAVRKITKEPIELVYDASSGLSETQSAGWQILAPNGRMVVARPPTIDSKNNIGKRLFFTLGDVYIQEKQEFTAKMYSALNEWLANGEIKVRSFFHGEEEKKPDITSTAQQC